MHILSQYYEKNNVTTYYLLSGYILYYIEHIFNTSKKLNFKYFKKIFSIGYHNIFRKYGVTATSLKFTLGQE